MISNMLFTFLTKIGDKTVMSCDWQGKNSDVL